MRLQRPSEILEQNPEIKSIWNNPADLGYLLRLKLIKGTANRRTCFIDVNSVFFLISVMKEKNILKKASPVP